MTKREAINQLINDFNNDCISKAWQGLDEMDWQIIKALGFKVTDEGQVLQDVKEGDKEAIK